MSINNTRLFAVYTDIIVPNNEQYGYFGFHVNNNSNLIDTITAYPIDSTSVTDFVKGDEFESIRDYEIAPRLKAIEILPPAYPERFAMKLFFDNTAPRKFVLDINKDDENNDVVSYDNHVFTDKIWASAQVTENMPARIYVFPDYAQAIHFRNGYNLSAEYCYINSTHYGEPIICNNTIYENDNFKFNRLWRCGYGNVYCTGDDRFLKIYSRMSERHSVALITVDGKRCTTLDFGSIGSFEDGLIPVGINGYGCGYMDENMNFVIPPQYDYADDFEDGVAEVCKDDETFFINTSGKETHLEPSTSGKPYVKIYRQSEGMRMVSIQKLDYQDLAYHIDHDAGIWGVVNENGKEIIAPQYIYAHSYAGGIAFVCKGKWEKKEEWKNQYWTDEELWGAIDKEGKEVIPFIFDDIHRLYDVQKSEYVTDFFGAHYGGWKNGKWGIIDKNGNWLVEPCFEELGYEYCDGLFTFYLYKETSCDPFLGIYDLKQKKVLFEPTFYDVNFEDDKTIIAETFDENTKRTTTRIFNRSGSIILDTEYSSIYKHGDTYNVTIRSNKGISQGLLDANGNVLYPCSYDVPHNGICYDKQRVIFIANNKYGLRDFDDNIIIPPIYNKIEYINSPFIKVSFINKNGLIDHDGNDVLPSIYDSITTLEGNRFLCKRNGKSEIFEYFEK